jgi:hypothetical protein
VADQRILQVAINEAIRHGVNGLGQSRQFPATTFGYKSCGSLTGEEAFGRQPSGGDLPVEPLPRQRGKQGGEAGSDGES